MNRFCRIFAAAAVVLAAFGAPATATPLTVALDIQGQGLDITTDGVGLETLGAGTASLDVQIDGPVQAALLYWAGRDRPCPQAGGDCVVPFQPYKDQQLLFDGNLVTGTIIGTEDQPVSAGGPINNIGYLADVTAIVQAAGTGAQSFSIADADLASNLFRLDGATLFVIFVDPADTTTYRIILFDGLDFAYGADPTPGETRVTDPVTFSYDALASARTATLYIAAGDAAPPRPNRIDISNNPSLFNTLDSSDGPLWDDDQHSILIPAGIGSTTVQIFSEPLGQNPASLLWELAALRLPLAQAPTPEPGDEGCTPGYWKNHPDAWPATGFSPGQTAGSVFAIPYPTLASRTLLQSLQGGGGAGALGAAKILLRAAVAALLNAASPGVDYAYTTAQIIADTNAALASGNRDTMLALAADLDDANNGGCPLN